MLDKPLQLIGQNVNGVEDGGQIHPGSCESIIDILDITEKHICLCKEQSQSHTEQIKLQYNKGEQQAVKTELSTCCDHNNDQSTQRENKIHHTAGDFGNRKNVPGNVGFFQQSGIGCNGVDGLMGGVVHKVKQELTAEQIHREVFNITLKHGGKHHSHDDHDQQRVQDTPYIAKNAAAVFQFDISGNQQSQQIAVVPDFLKQFQFQKSTPQLKS